MQYDIPNLQGKLPTEISECIANRPSEATQPYERLTGSVRTKALLDFLINALHVLNVKEKTGNSDIFRLDSKTRRLLASVGLFDLSVAGVIGNPFFNMAPMDPAAYAAMKGIYTKNTKTSPETIMNIVFNSIGTSLSITGIEAAGWNYC